MFGFLRRQTAKNEIVEVSPEKSARRDEARERYDRRRRLERMEDEAEMLRAQIRNEELRRDLADLYDDDDGTDPFEFNPDMAMIQLLSNIAGKGSGVVSAPQPPHGENRTPQPNYSMDSIRKAISSLPPERIKALKAMTDDQLMNLAPQVMPGATESEVAMAIQVVRG